MLKTRRLTFSLPHWMSSKSRARISRRDAAITWLGTMALYTIVIGLRRSIPADVVFATAALLVSGRRWLWPAAITPLGLALFGEISLGHAFVAVGLLLLGPFVVLVAIAVIGLPGYLLQSSETGLERAGALRLITIWAWRSVAVTVVAGTFALQGIVAAATVTAPAALAWRRKLIASALIAVSVSAATAWAPPPLILAAVCATAASWRLAARPPALQHPFPAVKLARDHATGLRVRRADRQIRRGNLIRARSILTKARRPSLDHTLRLAFVDVEERMYQSALSLASKVPPPTEATGCTLEAWLCASLLYGRALSGVAQFKAARAVYQQLLGKQFAWRLFDAYVRVLLAENALAAGDRVTAREHAEVAYASATAREGYFLRLRACCVLAESAIDDPADTLGFMKRLEIVQSEMLASRWVTVALEANPARLVRKLFGRHGSLHLYFVRVDTLSRRGDQLDDRTGWDPEAVALAMAVARWSDDLVEVLLTEARRAAQAGSHAARLRIATRALMELDGTRYRLAAQSSRTSWSRRFQRALSVALDAAHREQEHTFIAELLEFARIQALPATTGEAAGDIVLSTPPVVQLRGCARLARPGEPGRPDPVALENAANRAAGRGAWWLSYWEADDWLYWALIPPGASDIRTGRESIAASSDLGRDLATLQHALPNLLAGEDTAAADFRIARSPLLCDPAAELRLSTRLGRHLLPTQLIAAARAHDRGAGRLPLAIAPSASLGLIPWGLLAALRHGGRHDRLLGLCDWVLAPSAALVSQAPRGSTASQTPLALSIADTTDRSPFGVLPGARSQAQALPTSVSVLGGQHWARDVASVSAFEQKLKQLGPDITVAFFCHAVRGSSLEPSRGGLVLATPTQASVEGDALEHLEILSPGRIFAMAARGVPMPAQVLLQACDTSALSDAASGEWLTIAPAFVGAGSREVIATLFPTPDISLADDPVIQAAIDGRSLSGALALMQRTNLARWELGQATDLAHTPLVWAAYAPIRVAPRDDAGVFDPAAPASRVSARFVKVVGDAIKECQEGRAKSLHSGFLLSAVLDETGIADLLDGGGNSLRPSAFVWSLGPYICSRWLRIRDWGARQWLTDGPDRIEVSEALIDAFGTACRMAARDGVLVEPEHLLQAILAARSAARRILSLLSSLTRRHSELTHRAISHVLADAISRGQALPSSAAGQTSAHQRLATAFVELAATVSA